jgi:hypothetical protein
MNIKVKLGAPIFRYSLLTLIVNLLLLISLTSPASPATGALRINYRVSMDDAVNHNFRVTMTLEGVSGDSIMLKMPVFTGREEGNIHPSERRSFNGWMKFIAHEFFHLYNIKTIRPKALGPFDYDRYLDYAGLWLKEEAPVSPGGRSKYVIMGKEKMNGDQERIFNDLFRPVN